MKNYASNKSETWAFFCGFATASSLTVFMYYYSQYFHSRCVGSFKSIASCKEGDALSCKETERDKVIFDSPTLNNRILRKAETVIQGRTSRLLVVVERCTNDHNYSAILRTVEALGIQHVWVIAPPIIPTVVIESDVVIGSEEKEVDDASYSCENTNNRALRCSKPLLKSCTGNNVKRATEYDIQQRQQHHLFAQRAVEWLTIREFNTTEQCLQALTEEKRTIWVTDLSQHADSLTVEGLSRGVYGDTIIPERLAIVFGTESVGCTQTMLQAAHRRVHLTMRGFADSLNLSVAAALCILQLFHLCPEMVGQMSEEERKELRLMWFPKLASQRITTTGERAKRKRILERLKQIDELERKKQAGQTLQAEQTQKLMGAAKLRKQLEQLDDDIHQKAKIVVQSWIDKPPEPLSDMRRADMHRVCYVGRATKKRNEDIWKEMPATSNASGVEHATVTEFREHFKMATPSSCFVEGCTSTS